MKKMWDIVIVIFAIMLLSLLIGGCGYAVGAPTPSLYSISAEFAPMKKLSPSKVGKRSGVMYSSTLTRDRDVPKANF